MIRRNLKRLSSAFPAFFLAIHSSPAVAEQFTISGNQEVADVALRGNGFGGWNYGRGILLEAGYFIGLYDTHPGASLMRFNLSGLEADQVQSAKIRIYKPRSMSQQGPVDLSLHEVSKANGDWMEGGSASQKEPGAVSWRGMTADRPWAGAEGCSQAGIDYELPALSKTQTVFPETSGWIEFSLPLKLVQGWLDRPETNYGVYLRAQEDADLSDEAYFFSSEHPSGKGPQLVIEATVGPAKTKKEIWAWNPPKFLPPTDSPAYAKWKEKGRGRYKQWATGPEMHLSDEQGLWPYHWDTHIRMNTLAECFIPLAKSLVRLKTYIDANDQKAFDDEFDFVRRHLLKYEDVKGMRIHQSGPVAEELTSIQLGTMLGKEKFGVHAQGGIAKYPQRSTEEIIKLIDKELKKIRKDWNVKDEDWETMEKFIRLYEGNRWHEGNMTGKYMREVQSMLETGEESDNLYVSARKLFYHHKLYVYWLSDFNTPKWNLWMNIVKVDPRAVAQEFLDARDDNYQLDSYAKRIKQTREYYWYPPILYVKLNDDSIPEGGFGSREWPFKSVAEAVAVASDGTEIRVAGKVDFASVDRQNKNLMIEDGYNATFNYQP